MLLEGRELKGPEATQLSAELVGTCTCHTEEAGDGTPPSWAPSWLGPLPAEPGCLGTWVPGMGAPGPWLAWVYWVLSWTVAGFCGGKWEQASTAPFPLCGGSWLPLGSSVPCVVLI